METPQPKKASSAANTILYIVGAIVLLFYGLPMLSRNVLRSANFNTSPSTHSVIYKATTDRLKYNDCFGFDATYEMPSGTSQKGGGACGAGNSVVVDRRPGNSGDFVYLSIQNDEYAANIGCEIYIDGKLVYQTRSSGQYVIASCSGSIP